MSALVEPKQGTNARPCQQAVCIQQLLEVFVEKESGVCEASCFDMVSEERELHPPPRHLRPVGSAAAVNPTTAAPAPTLAAATATTATAATAVAAAAAAAADQRLTLVHLFSST
jgi:hypothetical protein